MAQCIGNGRGLNAPGGSGVGHRKRRVRSGAQADSMSTLTGRHGMTDSGVATWLRKSVDAKPGEGPALLWSTTYHFLVLCAYYVLRPIRDDMGAAGGVDNLAWLFLGTLTGMLLIHPIYTSLVTRLTRRRFIPLTYRFFILNLVVFFILFRVADASQNVWVGRIFFIWTSVFNLFVVSVFWSFMSDIFRPGQGKRLFGIVAVGGTFGAVFGSSITTALAAPLGPINLLLVSALILELAARASMTLDKREAVLRAADQESDAPADAPTTGSNAESVIGGKVLDGIRHVAQSPYLLGIAGLMVFFTIASTFLYFQQVAIVADAFGEDRAQRTQVFGAIDLAVNVLTLVIQLFVTGRVLRWLGVGVGLAFLPVVTVIGFAIMGFAPTLVVLIVFQVLRRAGNFGIQRPAREALYTVVPRSDKYKAKNFNDTFVYRFGDQVGAWSYTWMSALGLGLSGLAFSMVPLSIAWFALALWLAARYRVLEKGSAN